MPQKEVIKPSKGRIVISPEKVAGAAQKLTKPASDHSNESPEQAAQERQSNGWDGGAPHMQEGCSHPTQPVGSAVQSIAQAPPPGASRPKYRLILKKKSKPDGFETGEHWRRR